MNVGPIPVAGQPKYASHVKNYGYACDRTDAIYSDGIVDTADISELGIAENAFGGLEGVFPSNGVDAVEHEKITQVREKTQKLFLDVVGERIPKEEAEKLFQDVWGLVITGKFTRKEWNKLVQKYKLHQFEMTSEAFFAFFGNNKDNQFLAEQGKGLVVIFTYGLKCMLLNKGRLEQICNSDEDLNVIYIKNVDAFSRSVFAKVLKEDSDFDTKSASKSEMFEAAKKGDFGEKAQGLATYRSKDWDSFLIAYYEYLMTNMGKDLSADKESDKLEWIAREKYLREMITGKDNVERMPILVEQTALFMKGKTDSLSFKTIKEAEIEPEKIAEVDLTL